jgi:hypothetical protein
MNPIANLLSNTSSLFLNYLSDKHVSGHQTPHQISLELPTISLMIAHDNAHDPYINRTSENPSLPASTSRMFE